MSEKPFKPNAYLYTFYEIKSIFLMHIDPEYNSTGSPYFVMTYRVMTEEGVKEFKQMMDEGERITMIAALEERYGTP